MTCVVIALANGRAHIFADSAHIGPLGGLTYSSQKIRTFADHRFAIVTRGAAAHSLVLGALAWRCRSYIHAREGLSRALCGPLGRLLNLTPATFYVERTYRGAPAMAVETSAGEWGVWTRLDLGKLITAPALGRKSTAAEHAEAARIALMDAGRDCEIMSSRQMLFDEYEHTVECRGNHG